MDLCDAHCQKSDFVFPEYFWGTCSEDAPVAELKLADIQDAFNMVIHVEILTNAGREYPTGARHDKRIQTQLSHAGLRGAFHAKRLFTQCRKNPNQN